VDTSGTPDDAVSAVGPGMCSVSLGVLTDAVYVVACARRGSKTGPAATLFIPAPVGALDSPRTRACGSSASDRHPGGAPPEESSLVLLTVPPPHSGTLTRGD
jgi:hypothetical protein